MSDDLERARDVMERAQEEGEHGRLRAARLIAVLVASLAAALAILELGEKGAQNAALSAQIEGADTWAFYQAKTVRADLYQVEAELLESVGAADDPRIAARIKAAREQAARLTSDEATRGREQLQAEARAKEAERQRQFGLYENYEMAVGAVQIAIVLASASVVAGVARLGWAAAVLGGGAVLFGLLTRFGVI